MLFRSCRRSSHDTVPQSHATARVAARVAAAAGLEPSSAALRARDQRNWPRRRPLVPRRPGAAAGGRNAAGCQPAPFRRSAQNPPGAAQVLRDGGGKAVFAHQPASHSDPGGDWRSCAGSQSRAAKPRGCDLNTRRHPPRSPRVAISGHASPGPLTHQRLPATPHWRDRWVCAGRTEQGLPFPAGNWIGHGSRASWLAIHAFGAIQDKAFVSCRRRRPRLARKATRAPARGNGPGTGANEKLVNVIVALAVPA